MSAGRDVYLTRCPVGNATEIAVQKGWLAEGLAREGVTLRLLQELPPDRWVSHFSHEHPALFRDGGNIPPIWARSNGADSRVIGLNFNQRKTGILVKNDSPVRTLADLKGRRFALPVRRKEKIDFWRAAALKGILSSLHAVGLTKSDAEFVELPIGDPYIASAKKDAYWDSVFLGKRAKGFQREEAAALQSGKVDAIFAGGAWGERLVLSSVGRYIFDFDAHPGADRVNIEHPSAITVSGKFAEENPGIVVSFLRILIRASAWAKTNRDEVVRIYAKGSWLDDEEAERRARPEAFHGNLEPGLSDALVAGLAREKDFLLGNGFIGNDFPVEDWIDRTYLDAALKAERELRVVA